MTRPPPASPVAYLFWVESAEERPTAAGPPEWYCPWCAATRSRRI